MHDAAAAYTVCTHGLCHSHCAHLMLWQTTCHCQLHCASQGCMSVDKCEMNLVNAEIVVNCGKHQLEQYTIIMMNARVQCTAH